MTDLARRVAALVAARSEGKLRFLKDRYLVSPETLASTLDVEIGAIYTAIRKAEDLGLVRVIVEKDNTDSVDDPRIAVEVP